MFADEHLQLAQSGRPFLDILTTEASHAETDLIFIELVLRVGQQHSGIPKRTAIVWVGVYGIEDFLIAI